MPSIPVLFLVFNRPSLTRESLLAIRSARPTELFIAGDGPRMGSAKDVELCERTRRLFDEIVWDCNVKALFRVKNLGCQVAVSQAISWFFDHVDEGIILEDDCVADPSFFSFCENMLNRYRNESSVGTITGNNFQSGIRRNDRSYYFSKYNHCWGWATWKRAWQKYDHEMKLESGLTDEEVILNFACSKGEVQYWKKIFRLVRSGKINSWAYRWTHSMWKHKLLTVTPQANLVENIGFGSDATHTKRKNMMDHPAKAISSPFDSPEKITQHIKADEYCARKHFGVGLTPIQKMAIRFRQLIGG